MPFPSHTLLATSKDRDKPLAKWDKLLRSARHWYRADTVTRNGNNLRSMPNRGVAGGVLNVTTGTIAVPKVDAAFNNKLSIAFTATQRLTSSLPASEFTFMHDGTGKDVFVVTKLNTVSPGIQGFVCTRPASGYAIGAGFYANTTNIAHNVGNGTVNIFSPAPTYVMNFLAINTAYALEVGYSETSSPEGFIGDNTVTQLAAGASGGVPSTSVPAVTLQVGGFLDTGLLSGNIADIIIFNRVLSAADRQLVREYFQARYGIAAPVWTEEDRPIHELEPRHWYRADTNTLNGANLATLPNRGTVGGKLNVAAGTIVAPISDTALNNALSIALTGVQYLDSNLPKSEFKFLHDGTGADTFVVCVPTQITAGLRAIWATRSMVGGAADIGACMLITTAGAFAFQVISGGAVVINGSSAAGELTIDAPMRCEFSYREDDYPEGFGIIKSGVTPVLASATVPPIVDPSGTFRLGGGTSAGSAPAHCRIADVIIFSRRLTPYERQQVLEYIQTRYAIPAPVWSAEDREILKLNPYSWIRADNYIEASGKVTSFVDKVRPGHSMTQGTAANQVLDPAVDAALNGKMSASFVGGQFYSSSLPISAWRFAHNGLGADVIAAWVPTTIGGIQALWASETLGGGTTIGASGCLNGASIRFVVARGAAPAAVNVTSAAVLSVGVGAYAETSFGGSPEYTIRHKATLTNSGAAAAPPVNADGSSTMRMGASPIGLSFLNGRIGDMLFFSRVLTPTERAVVQQYMFSRYGMSA